MPKRFLILAVVVLVVAGGAYFYLSQENLVPDDWSDEKINESLLYSNGTRFESFKESFGRYPENLDELIATGASLNNDLFSNKPVRYLLSADKKSFDLRFTGLDGNFDTSDDIVFDPTRLASNLLPMYGGETAVKTPWMLQADKKFIDSVVKEAGSREAASISIAGSARAWLEQGDLDTAMKRFNQAWLLDPNNPESYRGFAEILKRQNKTEEAEKMLILAQDKEATR